MKAQKLIGVLDIGSNSIMLTVAIAHPTNPTMLTEFCKVTKLGEDSAKTGKLQTAAINRTAVAVINFVKEAKQMGVRHFVGTATSAVRDADNGAQFIEKLSSRIGFTPQILSGPEEACTIFLGSTAELPAGKKVITCDPGGGSTEINIGVVGEDPFYGHSFNVGCVRQGDKFSLYDQVKLENIQKAREEISKIFKPAFDSIKDSEQYSLYISGGTATTYAAVRLELEKYCRERVHLQLGKLPEMEKEIDRLFAMDLKERTKVPGLGERAPMLPTGMLIMAEVMKGFKKVNFTVTTNALRHGMLLKASREIVSYNL